MRASSSPLSLPSPLPSEAIELVPDSLSEQLPVPEPVQQHVAGLLSFAVSLSSALVAAAQTATATTKDVAKDTIKAESKSIKTSPIKVVPLVAVAAQAQSQPHMPTQGRRKAAAAMTSTRYVPLGVTAEAEELLSTLRAPLSIAVFTGFGRSGKSKAASRIADLLVAWPSTSPSQSYSASSLDSEGDILDNKNDKNNSNSPQSPIFASRPGNVPCTHGIDLAVVPHPDKSKGHILLLDCEGAQNHNQTAIPFVMGLAARLASKIFVFERACFTTAGLESVVQILNMGLATLPVQDDFELEDDSSSSYASKQVQPDMTRSLVLVENMSINSTIPSSHLLADLLSPTEDGDEMSNRVRHLVRDHFDVAFEKLPFVAGGSRESSEFDECCLSIAGDLVDGLRRFDVGGVAADGKVLVKLCNEQVRDGGSRFNMVSATESLVANMATEAANMVWTDFCTRAHANNNTPEQIKATPIGSASRKHLRTVLRELEGFANIAVIDLDTFTARLQPREPAAVARIIWDRNYAMFLEDVRTAHGAARIGVEQNGVWAVKMNRIVVDIVDQFVEALRQAVRLARFASMLAILSNYYFWKHGVTAVKNFASGVISEMID
ncbi:hypothetical protein HK100_012931 [Physocladia obscura]|uniref:Guanylate-binding protein N-terminal domain-containing protein n=1 Tax=Physocladia obscura TaxID=109957 RepID=A0AAD5TAQ7_9FUNG|nr:hypothetical protein HK100_012931 [Physocladia obscura]